MSRVEHILAAFQAHDASFNGHLNRRQLLALLRKLDRAWTQEQLEALLLAAGFLDADRVPYGPFLTWLFASTETEPRLPSNTDKAVMGPLTKQESDWIRLGGAELEEPLAKGWVKLVHAHWLVELADSGGVLQRCQDLPPEAFVSLDELKQAGVVTSPTLLFGDTEEWLRVIVLSYPWLQPGHPDPHGENLRFIAKVLKIFLKHSFLYYCGDSKPYGVLIDFTALPQATRTEEENEVFKLALPALNIFYSHPQTVIFKVTSFPAGYPSDSAYPYVLPTGSNTVNYAERGWCFAESAMSGLVKSSSKVLDFGCDTVDWDHATLWRLIPRCRVRRGAPLHPDDFRRELNMKTFTSKKADFDRVARLYSEAFERRFGSAKELNYSGLEWGADAVRKLLRAFPGNHSLLALNLSFNDIGSQGAAVLGEALQSNSSLQSLNLSSCSIGPQGAVALGQGLEVNSSLLSLDLNANKIGQEGAVALGQALQINHSLRSLDLVANQIDAQGAVALGQALQSNSSLQSLELEWNYIEEGAVALGHALQKNSCLQSLSLRSNNIGVQGAVALGQALRSNNSLRTLSLSQNDIGEEGTVALGHALQSNCSLQSLDLSSNGISEEGAVALGQALQSNSSLQLLHLYGNRIGEEGGAALGQALQSNCSLRELALCHNPIGPLGALALRQAAQTCQILFEGQQTDGGGG